jgi:hypothetical protein
MPATARQEEDLKRKSQLAMGTTKGNKSKRYFSVFMISKKN